MKKRVSATAETERKRGDPAAAQSRGFITAGERSLDSFDKMHRAYGNRVLQKMLVSGMLSPKLRIGQPDDIYEQEADRIADRVMRMPEPGIQRKPG